ncbi:hypothetical protein TNCV_4589811 [Trichonephila clavipes]|nr:hypothetical protein TNCV_4589811 [Trichonephila clavipes]
MDFVRDWTLRLDADKAPQHFLIPKLHQKRFMVTGGFQPVRFITATKISQNHPDECVLKGNRRGVYFETILEAQRTSNVSAVGTITRAGGDTWINKLRYKVYESTDGVLRNGTCGGANPRTDPVTIGQGNRSGGDFPRTEPMTLESVAT